MLNDFLSLNKLEEEDIKPMYVQMNFVAFLEELTHEVQLIKRVNQKLCVKHSGSEMIVSDRDFLRNILRNVLSNAFKYSHEGDIVLLEAEVSHEALTVRISDQGVGIPSEDREYIFTRFFRGHNVVNIQGTGLGLSIAKKYLDLLNGSIEFSSNLNKGSVFTVRVPIEI